MKKTIREAFGILRRRSGFSLVEMMIVVAIAGILAAMVGIYINTGKSELKTFVFNQKARFHLARFEAVKRGRNVYVDFDLDGDGNLDTLDDDGDPATPAVAGQGYSVWVDADNSNVPYVFWDIAVNDTNGNGECDRGDVGDCLIDTVQFDNILNPAYGRHGPEIYDGAAAFPTGGPDNVGPGVIVIGDGVVVSANRFRFSPNGDAKNGSLFLYFPEGPSGAKAVNSGPWAIIVAATGRVRIDRWGHMRPNGWDVGP